MSDQLPPIQRKARYRLFIGIIKEKDIEYVKSLRWKWICISRDGSNYICILQFKDPREPPKGGGVWMHPFSLREALQDLFPEIVYKAGKLDACTRVSKDMYALRYFPLTNFWSKSRIVYCPPIFHRPREQGCHWGSSNSTQTST